MGSKFDADDLLLEANTARALLESVDVEALAEGDVDAAISYDALGTALGRYLGERLGGRAIGGTAGKAAGSLVGGKVGEVGVLWLVERAEIDLVIESALERADPDAVEGFVDRVDEVLPTDTEVGSPEEVGEATSIDIEIDDEEQN